MNTTLNLNQQYNLYSDNRNKNNVAFKGPLDGAITQTLMTIDTNQMVNSALVDVVSMVAPRTYIDTKERNKYAGFETFFREITGTVIMCLSSGVVALGISKVYNKIKDPNTHIPANIWATNETFDVLKKSWNKGKNVNQYVENVVSNLSGLNGKETSKFNDIKWEKVQWFDDRAWDKINWKDQKWSNVKNETKSKEQIVKVLSDLIKDEKADKHDVKKVFDIVEHRIANALQVSKNVNVTIEDKTLSATLRNLLRDTHDLGKHIFNNKKIDLQKAEAKLKSTNKVKTLGSIAIVASIGLGNQYMNRLITKKRTGKDDFVGNQDFAQKNDKTKFGAKSDTKSSKLELWGLKALASAGILALSMGVMKIRNPKEFIKRLEFTGPITSGNAIKTLYTATLVGRFMAARDKNELRETGIRDYLGFLNWLVLGGFVSKGVAQVLFDKKQTKLFNVAEDGSKGIKKWLNNVSLKSHAEIAAKGSEFAKNNIWKLNVAHSAGLLYSSLALGFALPLLNILISKKQYGHNKNANNPIKPQQTTLTPGKNKFDFLIHPNKAGVVYHS